MSSDNEDYQEEEKISVGIEDVENEMLKHWHWLCEVNPGWQDAERLELTIGIKAELASPQLRLQHPDLFNSKKRAREDDHDLPGLSELRRPLVKTRITTNVVELQDVNDVLRPRKIESDWHKKRREKQEKQEIRSKKYKEKQVLKNREYQRNKPIN